MIEMTLNEIGTTIKCGIVGLVVRLLYLYFQGRNLKTFESVTITFPKTPRSAEGGEK